MKHALSRLAVTASMAVLGIAGPAGLHAQTAAEGRAALRSGKYDEAAGVLRRVLRADASNVQARRDLARALVTRGRYDEAEAALHEAPDPVATANVLGETLLLRGKRDEAEAAFRQAAQGGADDARTAEVNLAELMFRTGRVDEAMARFDRFIDIYNDAGGRLSPPDLVAVGRAVRYLGRTNSALFQDALKAFDEAAVADPGWAEPHLRVGELFLEKYQSPEAKTEFKKVLEVDPRNPRALLGMARALDFDGTSGAAQRVQEALKVNPDDADAHVFMARLLLSRERYDAGRGEAEKALEVNPGSLEALSMLAAAAFLADDTATFRSVRARALSLDPSSPVVDATVAELAVNVRRYQDAVDRARAALALDSLSWRSWGLLGMNQLRTGRIEEGRASLQRAFHGDPYNPWFKNSLDLLDTFNRYEIRSTEHFQLFLNRSEADVLEPYVAAIAEEAYDSLAARYGVEPPLPVRVEMYPSHADFSVRTLGETGLGALGVSFGSVVVLDSPAAREKGEYNWASTLWHELAHVFHLAMTDHRVPRWFSEGLAVHEQRRARQGWGHDVSIPFLQALRVGRLKKVSELNDGFMRPDYPEQVIFSYYEASLVFQLIEDRHGFEAIRRMLEEYARGATDEQVFQSVLGTSLDDFDDTFEDYMESRFAAPLKGLADLGDAPDPQAGIPAMQDWVRAHPGDLVARMRLGAMLVAAGRYEEARPHLTEALKVFPEYGGPDSPYLYLAKIHQAEGDPERAAAALARLNALSESNWDALMAEADVEGTLGNTDQAAWALRRSIQVYPYDTDVHERLAELDHDLGDRPGAVEERQAVVALNPPDRAEALYRLAVAELDAGSRDDARRTVLRALEIAPNYDDALELLLTLRGGGGGGRS